MENFMKKALFFVGLFVSFLSLSCAQQRTGFKSPEEVVKYIVQNVKNGNFENVLKTSAYYYDDIIDKFDAKEMAKRLNSLYIYPPLNLPKNYHSIIKTRLLGQHSLNIQMFVSSLLLPDEYDEFLEGKVLTLNNNEHLLDLYFSSLDNMKNLNSLELVRMDIIRPDLQFSDMHKQNIEHQKLYYGFDEQIEYIALFKLNNKYYIGGYGFVRYGSNWYILNYISIFLGQSSFGTVRQISEISEYLYECEIE
jgi:hypothetical protein